MSRNVLDGIFDDLMENKVLNRGELQRLGEEVDHIVNRTGDLVDDLMEKMQMAGKIFKDHFFNPKKQLSLSEYLSKGLVTCSLSIILMQFLPLYFFLQVDNILFTFLAPSLPDCLSYLLPQNALIYPVPVPSSPVWRRLGDE